MCERSFTPLASQGGNVNRARLFAGVALLSLLTISCGGDEDETFVTPTPTPTPTDGGTQPTPMPTPTVVTVISRDVVFEPVTITVGSTVRWENVQGFHTVTSGASSAPADNPGAMFDQVLNAGDSFEFTFTSAGTFPYFCRPHEHDGMRGTVTVTP
jgi:plastocyanin